MAGRGRAPKPADRRAGHSRDPHATTVLEFQPGEQPALPEFMPDGEPWPSRTHEWWAMWAESPLNVSFMATDWSELLDTAVLHGKFWSTGAVNAAVELRLRVAKFGATPEDRARLRIQFAQADEADSKRPVSPARERRTVLHALPETG